MDDASADDRLMSFAAISGRLQGSATVLTPDVLERVLDAAPVPMVVIDIERREIIRANAAAEERLGLPRGAMLGRSAREFVSEPRIVDGLRTAALSRPGTLTGTPVGIHTPEGVIRTAVSMTVVPGTSLAVVQVVEIDGQHSPERTDAAD